MLTEQKAAFYYMELQKVHEVSKQNFLTWGPEVPDQALKLVLL